MPLRAEIGDPAHPKRGTAPQLFGPCLQWPNGWMDEDATWYGSRPAEFTDACWHRRALLTFTTEVCLRERFEVSVR